MLRTARTAGIQGEPARPPDSRVRSLSEAEIFSKIRKAPLLSGIPEEALRTLATLVTPMQVGPRQKILTQGEYSNALFIVLSGLLHVRREGRGKPGILLVRLEAGDFFGEISLFDPGKTSATVQTVGDCTLVTLRREQLRSFLNRHPAGANLLMARLLGEMAKRLRRADDRLTESSVWAKVVQ